MNFQTRSRLIACGNKGVNMVTLEEFEKITEDIVGTLPKEFFRELSGGVIVRAERKIHPESVGTEMSIMGEYCRSRYLGRYVVIYYGSFMAVYRFETENALKERIRKTILHEFRHHLESLAGERDLEIEDARQLAAYKKKKMLDESKSE